MKNSDFNNEQRDNVNKHFITIIRTLMHTINNIRQKRILLTSKYPKETDNINSIMISDIFYFVQLSISEKNGYCADIEIIIIDLSLKLTFNLTI